MSVSTRRAIYGKMAGDTTLNNLLGDPAPGRSKAIYHASAPDGAEFPYVIFNKSSGTPTYTFKIGHASFDSEVWQIKAVDHSPDADDADNIASRLDALFTDGAITISGSTQLYLRRESDFEYQEVVDGEVYHHAVALYRLIYSFN